MGARRKSSTGTLVASSTILSFFATTILITSLGARSVHADTPQFVRGDADTNGLLEVTDPIALLNFFFLGVGSIPCRDAGDADDNGQHCLTDAIYILNFVFLGGPSPIAPFPDCGVDPTDDLLDCESYPVCAPSVESEWPEVAAMYGNLEILAGTGEFRGDGLNAWQEEFEGVDATTVELSRPHNAMADAAGNVYIADKGSHGIRQVRPDGTIVTVAGTKELGDGPDTDTDATEVALDNPNGVWVHADGTFFILDTGNSKIRRVETNGMARTLFSIPEGLVLGRGLWVSEDEDEAFVTSANRVLRWTREGGVKEFSGGYIQLGNIDMSPKGELYVTDRHALTVYRLDSDGNRTPVAGNGDLANGPGGGDGGDALDTALHQPRGIFFHPLGGYFVAEHSGSRLWYVDTIGKIRLFINGSNGAHCCNGQAYNANSRNKLSEIRNVTVDHSGNVLITENDAGFVRIVEVAED